MNPWEVLGIPEETTDPTDIRKAYAARVKECPPDVDPEGFRRVREAYEALRDLPAAPPVDWVHEPHEEDPPPDGAAQSFLAEREPRDEAEGHVDDAVRGPPVLAEREARPRPVESKGDDGPVRDTRPRPAEEEPAGVEAIHAAAALPRGAERDRRLLAAVRALADRMRGERQLVPAWSRAVLAALDDPERPWLFASATRVSDVKLDLLEAEGRVAERVIETLQERGKIEHIETIAAAVVDDGTEPRGDVGRILALLASSVAILAADLARALADMAFRCAVRKEDAIPAWLDLDRRLAAGSELGDASRDVRAFVAGRVEGRPWDRGDRTKTVQSALRRIARLGQASALRALLQDRAPDVLAAAEASYRPRKKPRPVPEPELEGCGWRYTLMVLAILFVLGRACGKDRDPDPGDWRERYREMEDRKKSLEERLRKIRERR